MSDIPHLPEFPCVGLLSESESAAQTPDPEDTGNSSPNHSPDAADDSIMAQTSSSLVNPPASPRGVDSLIAEELSKLTLIERQQVEDDVHGNVHPVAEDTGHLEQCLAQLQVILEQRKSGTAYELAQSMDPSYAASWDLRAMFVRVDGYDANDAAGRIIRFFELKKDLFGAKNLVKDITLKDLNEDDKEALMSGGIQVCPSRDNAGRPIVAMMLGLRKYKSIVNMQRAGFYVYMSVAQTIEAQRYGVVSVTYAVGLDSFETLQGRLRYGLPIRLACQHLAYDDPFCYEKATAVIRKLSRLHMVRFRSHKGTHKEVQEALADFGIPLSTLPVDSSGVLSKSNHDAWLGKRVELEEMDSLMLPSVLPPVGRGAAPTPPAVVASIAASSVMLPPPPPSLSVALQPPATSAPPPAEAAPMPAATATITPRKTAVNISMGKVDPRPSDILFGRGKSVVEHPGNTWFRNLVDQTMMQYDSCSRVEKANLSEMIVDMVKGAGGRFLKPEDEGDGWEEADDTTARKKVAHTFRNRRKFHFRPGETASSMTVPSNGGYNPAPPPPGDYHQL
eukprot:Nitzschia sp. Nitz4//scaffold105_size73764//68855//70710//NITZ4_005686-RA/size73764-processed-gene-0.101-mRNA-1//-1//CDS//3329532477//836//frame0